MRRTLPALALALTLATSACGFSVEVDAAEGGDAPLPTTASDPATGEGTAMCAPGVVDCVDVVVEGEGGVAGDEPIMAPDIPVVDVLQQEPRLVTPQPGASDAASPIFLQEATVDGTTLRVSFSGGHAPCFVVDTAEAVESDDAVVVNVRAGAAKGTDQASCTTIVELQYVEIELEKELGARQLLDGSRVFQGDVEY